MLPQPPLAGRGSAHGASTGQFRRLRFYQRRPVFDGRNIGEATEPMSITRRDVRAATRPSNRLHAPPTCSGVRIPKPATLDSPEPDQPAWIQKFDDTGHTPYSRIPYHELVLRFARLVSGIDDNIGRLLQRLESIGRLNDAVVIFTSDNGFDKPVSEPVTCWSTSPPGKGTGAAGAAREPGSTHDVGFTPKLAGGAVPLPSSLRTSP
jgi:arylsulfatase A-like enzyme